MSEFDIPAGSYDSSQDSDVTGNSQGVYATTDSGHAYETTPQHGQDFYDPEMWNTTGKLESQMAWQEDFTRPDAVLSFEEEQAFYNRSAEKQAAAPTEFDQQAASITLKGFSDLYDAPAFQQYLDSDDESYQQVRLQPELLSAVEQVLGIDEATAKSFVAFYKPTPLQLQTLAKTLGVNVSTDNLATYLEQSSTRRAKKPTEVIDYASDEYEEDSEAEYVDYSQYNPYEPEDVAPPQQVAPPPPPPVEQVVQQGLSNIRQQYFPALTGDEWQEAISRVVDVFEALPPNKRDEFDNEQGFLKLYHISKGMQKAARTRQSKAQQVSKAVAAGKVPASAFTPRGMLKASYINSLSDRQYQYNADKLQQWINSQRVDWQA